MPREWAGLASTNGSGRPARIPARSLAAVFASIALSQTLMCQSHLEWRRQLDAPGPSSPLAQKKGRLTVVCAEVDCNVLLDGAPAGATTDRAVSHDLPEGPVAVSVSADGYQSAPDQEIVNIKAGDPKLVKFELRPSRAALEERGAKLFLQMIAALGGAEGLKAAAALRGTGTLTLYRDGKPEFWQATLLLKLPDKSRSIISVLQNDRQRYEIVSTGGVTDLVKMGKGADLEGLNLAVHQLSEYQLARTLQRLQNPGVTILATDLEPAQSAGTMLRGEGGSEVYSIRLDAELRPQEIFVESGGFDKGIRILYADYAREGPAWFPRRLQVQLPGSATNGVKIQFDRLQLSPADLTDSAFDSKKGKTR
jgi:hypothetical protein